jgi:hypothetical protein
VAKEADSIQGVTPEALPVQKPLAVATPAAYSVIAVSTDCGCTTLFA